MQQDLEIIVDWLKALAPRFPDIEITAETALINQGLLDSIEILNLVCFVEERFAVVVTVEAFVPENFRTAHAVAAMVGRLRGNSA